MCLGKGKVHYIEVISDSEEEEKVEQTQVTKHNDFDEQLRDEEHSHKGGKVEPLPPYLVKFNSFRVCGVLQGKRVIVLVDIKTTHNFIDSTLVAKRGV